jgi:hypothetical protein
MPLQIDPQTSFLSSVRSSFASIVSEGSVCFREYFILAVLYLANDVTANVPMHAQNFMLYLISLVLSVLSEFIWSDWESPLMSFLVKGMFPWGFGRAFLHAIAGIVISFIYKYADPIVKTLAVSLYDGHVWVGI